MRKIKHYILSLSLWKKIRKNKLYVQIILLFVLLLIYILIYIYWYTSIDTFLGARSYELVNKFFDNTISFAVILFSYLIFEVIKQNIKKDNRTKSLRKEINHHLSVMENAKELISKTMKDIDNDKSPLPIIDKSVRYESFILDKLSEEGEIWDVTEDTRTISEIATIKNRYNRALENVIEAIRIFHREKNETGYQGKDKVMTELAISNSMFNQCVVDIKRIINEDKI